MIGVPKVFTKLECRLYCNGAKTRNPSPNILGLMILFTAQHCGQDNSLWNSDSVCIELGENGRVFGLVFPVQRVGRFRSLTTAADRARERFCGEPWLHWKAGTRRVAEGFLSCGERRVVF